MKTSDIKSLVTTSYNDEGFREIERKNLRCIKVRTNEFFFLYEYVSEYFGRSVTTGVLISDKK